MVDSPYWLAGFLQQFPSVHGMPKRRFDRYDLQLPGAGEQPALGTRQQCLLAQLQSGFFGDIAAQEILE